MKICIIGSSGVPIPPTRGGAVERHIYDLARFLEKSNSEVHILTLRQKNATEEMVMNGIHLHRGGFFEEDSIRSNAFLKHLSFFLYIILRLARMETDVIHAHNGIPGFAALLVSRIKGIPFIFTSHTSYTRIQHRIDGENRRLESAFEDFQVSLEKFCARNSSYAIAVSKKVREGLLSVGVPANRIFYIPNGVDAQRFRQDSANAMRTRQKFNFAEDRVVLYVGRIVKYKGLDYLVDSAAEVIREHPNVRFVVTGPVSYYSTNVPTLYSMELRKRIESQKLSEHFVFTGSVSEEDLLGLYSSCDLLILPSLSEPFGMVLIEAMSCQKPVMGTRIDGIVDIIHDGEDGYLVSPAKPKELASRINALLSNPSHMKELGLNGRKHVERTFDWSILASRIMEIYRQAIMEKQG